MDTSKITNYKEIVPYLEKIMEELDKKGRGFIFSTCPKDDGNKTARPLTCIKLSGDDDGDIVAEFWGGLLCIVDALNKQIPEDARPIWRDSYITFIQATAKLCFPNFRFERVNINGKQNNEKKKGE